MNPAGRDMSDLAEAFGMLWGQVSPSAPARWTEGTPAPTPSEGPDPYGDLNPEWLRIDWREHLRDVEVQMADAPAPDRVHYVELGPGDVGQSVDGDRGRPEDAGPRELLLVHGLSGHWQNWLETIPYFARTHRVVALDLPGFGQSPKPSSELSIPYYGQLLRAFADAVGLDDCALVGHSMGGFASIEAVLGDGARFSRLALAAPAGISSAEMHRDPVEAAARIALATTPLALRAQTGAIRRPGLREGAFRTVFHRPDLLRPELLYESVQREGQPPGFLDAIVNIAGYDLSPRLGEIELPTLIVWGRNDRIVPPRDAARLASHLEHASTAIFDACGHMAMLERPVRFNRTLEAFLAG